MQESPEKQKDIHPPKNSQENQTKVKKWFKITLSLIVLASLIVAIRMSPIASLFNLNNIRQMVLTAGALGIILFIALNTLSMIIHLPGMLFPVSAMLIFGELKGFFIAYLSSYIAINISFLFFRLLSRLGKTNLHSIKNQRIQRLLDKIETHPILAVSILRIFAGTSPPVNSALALTDIRFSKQSLASLTVIMPVLFFSVLTYFFQDQVLSWLS